jgi:hypothetical protein
MMRTTIQHVVTDKQGSRMETFALHGYTYSQKMHVHDILRDRGHVQEGCFYVHVNDLDIYDKKTLLSFVTDDFEYEDALKSPTKFEAYWKEYKSLIEQLLFEEGEEAYQDVMEDAVNYYDE